MPVKVPIVLTAEWEKTPARWTGEVKAWAKRRTFHVLAGAFLLTGVLAGQARAQQRAQQHRPAEPAPQARTHAQARAIGEMRQRLHRLMERLHVQVNGRSRGVTGGLERVASALDRTLQEMEAMVCDRGLMHDPRNLDASRRLERQMDSMLDTLDAMIRTTGEVALPRPRRHWSPAARLRAGAGAGEGRWRSRRPTRSSSPPRR